MFLFLQLYYHFFLGGHIGLQGGGNVGFGGTDVLFGEFREYPLTIRSLVVNFSVAEQTYVNLCRMT